jgi:hypothetical protein
MITREQLDNLRCGDIVVHHFHGLTGERKYTNKWAFLAEYLGSVYMVGITFNGTISELKSDDWMAILSLPDSEQELGGVK